MIPRPRVSSAERALTEALTGLSVVHRTGLIGERPTWYAWVILRDPTTARKGIAIVLIEREGGQYSTKVLFEDDHPYFFDPPPEFAHIADPPSTENARKWRTQAFPRGVPRFIK